MRRSAGLRKKPIATAPSDITTYVALIHFPPFDDVPEPIGGRSSGFTGDECEFRRPNRDACALRTCLAGRNFRPAGDCEETV